MLRFFLYLILFILIYYFIKNIVNAFKTLASDRKKKRDGNVTINFNGNKKNRKSNNDIGEYVDYEEVDE